MARILKWKQRLALGFVALFLSTVRVWAPRNPSVRHEVQGRIHSTVGHRTALGIELMAQLPLFRLVRASLVPVALPLSAGAYVAMAAEADPAASGCSSGTSGRGGGGSCYTYACEGPNGTIISYCRSCGTGQCDNMCFNTRP